MDMKSVGSIYYENFVSILMNVCLFNGTIMMDLLTNCYFTLFFVFFFFLFGQAYNMVPFKRPAGDKSGIPVYQPGATTYQQLMQMQQPFVPVSCEYPSPSPSATTTIPQTSTANPIANSNNKSHYLVNNSNNNNNNNNNNSHFNNNNNKNIMTTTSTTTVATNASIQASLQNILNNHNNINSSNNNTNNIATSNATNSVAIEQDNLALTPTTGTTTSMLLNGGAGDQSANDDDNDDVAAAVVQQQQQQQQLQQRMLTAAMAMPSVSALVAPPPTLHYAQNKVTPTSHIVSSSHAHLIQAPSTVSQSQSLAAPISTPYITYTQTQAHLHHQPQAQSQQHHHPLHHTQSLYADPAAIAKEVAQKNYANALKLAAASNTLTGKPLTSLSYTNVTLNKPALLPQPPQMTAAAAHAHHAAAAAAAVSHPAMQAARYPSHHQYAAAAAAAAAAATPNHPSAQQMMQMSPFARQAATNSALVAQNPYANMLRPQYQTAAANQYAAAAAMQHANQQYQNFLYHSLPAGYPFGGGAMPTQMPPGMSQGHTITGMPTLAAHPQAQTTPAPPGTAVVLNPYKKMKTS
jgi:muscleblind